jgi:flavin-dependent dehydrogenase
MNKSFDVIVVVGGGGGHAGSSSSAISGEAVHRVLLLEREEFPRYHSGESLIPFTYFPQKRPGLVDPMKESHFIQKFSVCFVPPNGRTSWN